MIIAAIIIALLIAAACISYNGQSEEWPHPEPRKDNPYTNWKE